MKYMIQIRKVMRALGFRHWRTGKGVAFQWRRLIFFWHNSNQNTDREGCITFRCNICGQLNESISADLHRELRSCWYCGSTVRFRAIVHLLAEELLKEDLPLPDFPKHAWCGVGLSDWEGYARPLAEKWQYTNTFYHCEPFLDITDIPREMKKTLDFLIASDVFEHIIPPVAIAFENARQLLKPGGLFILTVPYVLKGETQEHYPELFDYEILEESGHYTLNNVTHNGQKQCFTELVFHEGEGLNLELRMFSREGVLKALHEAGFENIQIHHKPCYRHGIVWLEDQHLPITARAPNWR